MQKQFLQINNVSFKYPGSVEPVLNNIYAQFSRGWTGIAGANGSGKTTLLKVAAGILNPSEGSVKFNGVVHYCEQRTDELSEENREFFYSYNKHAYKIKDMLGVVDSWAERWNTLSHGERKRVQIGAALYLKPDILIIDEPTNHIDYNTKQLLVQSLKSYNGIGIIVSHDRELLDNLCHHTGMISQSGLTMRKGNYSTFEEEMNRENEYLLNRKEIINKEIKKLETEAKRRKHKAAQADKDASKRNIAKHDHDAKSKMDTARLLGKDATEGQIYKRLKNRLEKKSSEYNSINAGQKKQLGINIESDDAGKSVLLFSKSGRIELGIDKALILPDMYIRRKEKIGLSGVNGSGKSTLINKLVKELDESGVSFLYIKQELTAGESAEILEEVKTLKNEDKGRIFTIIDKLGSDPKKLLDSVVPSPGEVRKVMLAKGLLDNQQLIIMDEPTNHMDLPSIKCVEEALQEFNGSLLLVSHDMVFLNNIVDTFWKIESDNETNYKLKLV